MLRAYCLIRPKRFLAIDYQEERVLYVGNDNILMAMLQFLMDHRHNVLLERARGSEVGLHTSLSALLMCSLSTRWLSEEM